MTSGPRRRPSKNLPPRPGRMSSSRVNLDVHPRQADTPLLSNTFLAGAPVSDLVPVKRALISVFDKTGLADFAKALHHEFHVELISTGGTARFLREQGLPVTDVSDVTGFPEMMDGRVKTLHPMIHGGLLSIRDNPEHKAAMDKH